MRIRKKTFFGGGGAVGGSGGGGGGVKFQNFQRAITQKKSYEFFF